MKYRWFICFLVLAPAIARPQTGDSLHVLSEVTVRGFDTNRKLLETAASVSLISQKTIQRFAGNSLTPALNTVPGVRMEERSPGSYRLSVRGSLLRSPFGIRNIKVYMDDIPFTDAGGNTYLNLAEPATLASVEILKGPAASLYGAGTGGAVLLKSLLPAKDSILKVTRSLQLVTGAYGLLHQQLHWRQGNNRNGWQLHQSHLQSSGYREHSRMKRETVHVSGHIEPFAKMDLKGHLLFTSLYYQTPGGLTEAQWKINPRSARPATAVLPGALQQKAAVYNNTLFTGLSAAVRFSSRLTHSTSLMFSHTTFKNPFITNYERRAENNRGLRSQFEYKTAINQMPLQLTAGGEWQSGGYDIDNFGNRGGVPDTVQSQDDIAAYQRFGFIQANAAIHRKWFITAGFSYNGFTYRYVRISNGPAASRNTKQFQPVVSPRLAVLFNPFSHISIRAGVSKGFSPPTIAELRPSEGSFFENLQPEYGWNYEAGLRADFQKRRLQIDITAYNFNLADAIVRRSLAGGGEYFVNAGGTRQKGIEITVNYSLITRKRFMPMLRIWTALTLNGYYFRNYKIDNTDYSGRELTGVPKKIFLAGVDLEIKNGFYLNCTYNYTSKLPFNDANDFYADDYHLLQCKAGYRTKIKKTGADIFVGADNLFNENYSLGNDINAVGNRFYNAAPLRNYFGGISFNW